MVEPKVRLVSQEGEKIEVEKSVIGLSILVKSMLEEANTEEEIPLPNVKSAILKKIIEFCAHVKETKLIPEIEKPLKSYVLSECVDKWFADYINVDKETLFEIILAANYLDIKSLIDLGCALVAIMMKDKSVEQIREMFHIQNDFTPEEEQQIINENKWADDSY